jgi:hypothetical protein
MAHRHGAQIAAPFGLSTRLSLVAQWIRKYFRHGTLAAIEQPMHQRSLVFNPFF